ncbi:MAG: hypothetical protein RML46_05295 [Anaerolineae bacterium]|nr:hypothetical protein [Anaerolineae bacterium]MDW8068309.1 hypothetical protein [Anaerolineae bacterium]
MKTAIPVFVLLMILVACTPKPFASPTSSPSTPPFSPLPLSASWEEITPIGNILADPMRYRGQEVTIVAYYRGWDLLGEAGTGPPRTRSDILVADPTGAIYIAPAGREAIKGLPLLLPFQIESTETLLRLRGTVELTERGQPYILVTKMEEIKGLPARVLLRVRRTGGFAGMDHELTATADGVLYFLDRKSRTHVRWKAAPAQIAQAVERLRPLMDGEVGTPLPDGFAYTITLQDGEQVRTATFYEGQLSEEAARALAPIQEWFGEAMERSVRPTPTPMQAYPEAVMAAVRRMAEQRGIPPEEIRVVSWEPVDWPDTSLGCPEPGMVYAQVIVPGYQVVLEVWGELHRVHTDRSGQQIVFCLP